jgi:hypothetical protein
MHVPDRRGVDVVMHMFLDDHWAVRIMDVCMMSVRIDRIGHRSTYDDTHMKAIVRPVLVGMVMVMRPVPVGMVLLVYIVRLPMVVGGMMLTRMDRRPVMMAVVRRPMMMPAMAMLSRIVSQCRC